MLAAEFQAILRAAEDEPVESGVRHSAESALADYVSKNGRSGVGVIESSLFASGSTQRIVDGLILLGRIGLDEPKVRRSLLSRALRSKEVQVRDAGIQAAELWEDRALGELLEAHDEPVGWLAEYAAAVATDLGA